MGRRGPKPKPTAIRVREGNPGRLPINADEPLPPIWPQCPTAPEWLGDIGRAKWTEVAPTLLGVGCLTVADYDLLAMLCEAHDELHAAMAEIAEHGRVAYSDKGSAYQHPAVGIKNKAIQRIRQFGNDFGMSPAARTGLKVGTAEGADDLDNFKAGG